MLPSRFFFNIEAVFRGRYILECYKESGVIRNGWYDARGFSITGDIQIYVIWKVAYTFELCGSASFFLMTIVPQLKAV